MNIKAFILSIVAFAALTVPSSVSGQYTGYLLDTLESSSSIDTVILYPGGTTSAGAASVSASKYFTAPGSLSLIIHTDSLSGSTNATLYVEVANRISPNLWDRVSTTTLNGAATQKIHYSDDIFANSRWRIWAVTASGTQNTKIQCEWLFKPDR